MARTIIILRDDATGVEARVRRLPIRSQAFGRHYALKLTDKSGTSDCIINRAILKQVLRTGTRVVGRATERPLLVSWQLQHSGSNVMWHGVAERFDLLADQFARHLAKVAPGLDPDDGMTASWFNLDTQAWESWESHPSYRARAAGMAV